MRRVVSIGRSASGLRSGRIPHEAERGRVRERDGADAVDEAREHLARLPVRIAQVDLGDQDLAESVEELVAAADVVVERHRGDAEFVAEPAHRQGLGAFSVDDREGALEDAPAAQRRAGAASA